MEVRITKKGKRRVENMTAGNRPTGMILHSLYENGPSSLNQVSTDINQSHETVAKAAGLLLTHGYIIREDDNA